MKLFIKQIEGLKLPSKANELDAGYDVIATSGPNVVADKLDILSQPLEDRPALYRAITYVEYDTNLFVAPASTSLFNNDYKEWHLELFPRSSISKYNLVLANSVGTIDFGYRNQVKVRFKYIFQPKDYTIQRDPTNQFTNEYKLYGAVDPERMYQIGDKIAQLKPRQNVEMTIEAVDELPAADSRGLGGFGSSGK